MRPHNNGCRYRPYRVLEPAGVDRVVRERPHIAGQAAVRSRKSPPPEVLVLTLGGLNLIVAERLSWVESATESGLGNGMSSEGVAGKS
jgi:hypothetical protein